MRRFPEVPGDIQNTEGQAFIGTTVVVGTDT